MTRSAGAEIREFDVAIRAWFSLYPLEAVRRVGPDSKAARLPAKIH
jgi:hypothetical protein